jgi:hypothetical protein
MLKLAAIAVAVVIAALLAIAATRPDTFRVQRTALIQALPEEIFAEIQDFRRWTAWSPFEKMDPAMKRTHGGAASGQGATYAWEGNAKAGAGRMVIVQAPAPRRVEIEIDFLKPFKAHNTAEFTLEPRGDGTQVTWSMHGPSPFVSKVIGLFVDMDRMIGKDFETGLANLKAIAEA